MKTILIGIVAFLGYLGTGVASIWAVVEFILYLTKDKLFNWGSIWMLSICIGVVLLISITSIKFAFKSKGEIRNFTGESKKSWEQEQLEQMHRKFKKRM